MRNIVLLIALLLSPFTGSFANAAGNSYDCRHWDICINKQNVSSREDIVSAFQAITAIDGAELELGMPPQLLDGSKSSEIVVSVDFPDFPTYDFEGDLANRKSAAETFAELSKRPGIKATCRVDNNGPINNGRGSVSN